MDNQVILTEDFLKSISYHLSSNPMCRRKEYRLDVMNDLTLRFWPEIKIFPNRYTRKEESKISVLHHVINEHFHDTVFSCILDDGSIQIKSGSLVEGSYLYKLSVSGKRRRWQRLKV